MDFIAFLAMNSSGLKIMGSLGESGSLVMPDSE
jgi:hypothetical protein